MPHSRLKRSIEGRAGPGVRESGHNLVEIALRALGVPSDWRQR